jgi:uncharacterized protein (TIGR02246 family)
MRHAVCIAVLVLAACPGAQQDAVPTKPETPTEVIASARAAVETWRLAYEMRNFDTLAKLYQHDIDLVVVHDGQPLVGWNSVEGMLRDRIARYKEIHVRLKDIQVASLGPEAATATAAMTRELGDGTTTVNEVGALTFVLHKTGDNWLVIVEHYSYKRGR